MGILKTMTVYPYIHTYIHNTLFIHGKINQYHYNKIPTVLFTYKIKLLAVFHDCRVGIRFESKFVYLSIKA